MVMRAGNRNGKDSALSRAVAWVFTFVNFTKAKFAEFEILFVLFFIITFAIFKHLMSWPENGQILVKKPSGIDLWP